MNIFYSGDRNTEDGIIISALSLIKNNDEPINFYILTAETENDKRKFYPISEEFGILLDGYVKKINSKNSAKLINITDRFMNNPPVKNMNTRFTPFCMLRLYADEVSELPDKILYLDNDVLCRKSIEEFYNQDLSDYDLAGVLDYYGRWFFKRNIFKFDYLNSGVLLLNLKKIRQDGLFYRCRQKCAEDEMFMPDQSAINKLCDKKLILSRRYNEQRKLKKSTVMQHFTTSFRLFPFIHTVSVKPWNIERLHSVLKIYEYDDILNDYLKIKADKAKKSEEDSNE